MVLFFFSSQLEASIEARSALENQLERLTREKVHALGQAALFWGVTPCIRKLSSCLSSTNGIALEMRSVTFATVAKMKREKKIRVCTGFKPITSAIPV